MASSSAYAFLLTLLMIVADVAISGLLPRTKIGEEQVMGRQIVPFNALLSPEVLQALETIPRFASCGDWIRNRAEFFRNSVELLMQRVERMKVDELTLEFIKNCLSGREAEIVYDDEGSNNDEGDAVQILELGDDDLQDLADELYDNRVVGDY